MKNVLTKARNFPTPAQNFEQPKKVLCYTIKNIIIFMYQKNIRDTTIYPEIFRSLKLCYPKNMPLSLSDVCVS